MTGPPRIYFVTFATSDLAYRQRFVNQTAVAFAGGDFVIPWDEVKLKTTAFFQENKDILSEKRGFGYYMWKPYIILAQFKKIRDGD